MHCRAGVSRSTSCVLAYLMKHERMSFNQVRRSLPVAATQPTTALSPRCRPAPPASALALTAVRVRRACCDAQGVAHCMSRRPIIHPNSSFILQLARWEVKVRQYSSVTHCCKEPFDFPEWRCAPPRLSRPRPAPLRLARRSPPVACVPHLFALPRRSRMLRMLRIALLSSYRTSSYCSASRCSCAPPCSRHPAPAPALATLPGWSRRGCPSTPGPWAARSAACSERPPPRIPGRRPL